VETGPKHLHHESSFQKAGVDVINDYNFLRFLPIFGEKLAFFSQKPMF
jgi:hypothetical protein